MYSIPVIISLHHIHSLLNFLLFKPAFINNLLNYIFKLGLLKFAQIIKLRLKIDIFNNIIPACDIIHNNRGLPVRNTTS